jgi:hypothetical protein
VNVSDVVTPLATVVLLVCVVKPLFATVTVYVPTGIQLVVKRPVELLDPETVVGITPPLIVTVAPLTTAPPDVTTFTETFPAVAIGMFRVLVAPPVTPTARVRDR